MNRFNTEVNVRKVAFACDDHKHQIWRSRSDKDDYRQQEVLQEEVSPMIRGTLDDERSFR